MGAIRTGTVGYSYRDWAGIFYPQGTPPRRQFNIYAQSFDVCELTQFTNQMPDLERMQHFATQIRGDLALFVRLHNTFTHCADIGLALTVAKHFRKAMDPLAESGKLAGLVAAFPYAFKDTPQNREYIQLLASALELGPERPLQLDFRHGSWAAPEALDWVESQGLGYVCVDEPELPGLVAPLVVATAKRVLVRLHGRNAACWWSGNSATRHDYLYSELELEGLRARYARLIAEAEQGGREVSFLFANNWQAQSVGNARQWKAILSREATGVAGARGNCDEGPVDEDSLRPPTTLPMSEVKSRVSRALSLLQESLDLPPRES